MARLVNNHKRKFTTLKDLNMESIITKLYRLTGIAMHITVIAAVIVTVLTLRDAKNQFFGTPFGGVSIVEEESEPVEVKVVETDTETNQPDPIPTFTPEPQENPLGSMSNPIPLGTTVTMPDGEFEVTVTDVILDTNMDGFEERVTAVGLRIHYTGSDDLKDFMSHYSLSILGSKGQVKNHEAWGSSNLEIIQGAQISGSTVEGYRMLITEGEGDTLLLSIRPHTMINGVRNDVWFKLYQGEG